jgi:hypothetical protein
VVFFCFSRWIEAVSALAEGSPAAKEQLLALRTANAVIQVRHTRKRATSD